MRVHSLLVAAAPRGAQPARRRSEPRGRAAPWLAPVVALALLALSPPALAVDPTAQEEQQKKAAEILRKKAEVDKKAEAEKKGKIWSVWAIFETHWKVVHDNYTPDDVYHTLYLWANIDPPKFWRIPALGRFSLRVDFTRKYVADPDESGILFGDLRLYYSRPFSFKIKGQEFMGRGYFYWTFPTSKVAQKEGNIARPTLLGTLVKEIPHGVSFIFRPYVRLNWARYAEAEGGMPNQKWLMGYDLWATWQLPWHKPLGLGLIGGQDWYNRYDARDGGSQPWSFEWFWEAYVSYALLSKPRWPVSLELYMNIASGHKNIEDGVWRARFVDRRDTEMYLSIWAMY